MKNTTIFLVWQCQLNSAPDHLKKGTYLWGPDELENMTKKGNKAAEKMYGGSDARPLSDASDALWRQYIIAKYERRAFAPKGPGQVHAQSIGNKKYDDKSSSSSPFRVPTNTESKSKTKKGAPTQAIDHGVPVDDLLNLNGYENTTNCASVSKPSTKESRSAKNKSGKSLIEKNHGNDMDQNFVSEQDFFAQFGL